MDEAEEKEIYVWAGFVKPGKHTVVVKGSDEQLYHRNYAVSIREQDIGKLKHG